MKNFEKLFRSSLAILLPWSALIGSDVTYLRLFLVMVVLSPVFELPKYVLTYASVLD